MKKIRRLKSNQAERPTMPLAVTLTAYQNNNKIVKIQQQKLIPIALLLTNHSKTNNRYLLKKKFVHRVAFYYRTLCNI